MIHRIESGAPDVPPGSPFGCKILAAANAYGVSEPFAQFWRQDGGAALAAVDGEGVLLEGAAPADWEELRRLLGALGLRRICCPAEAAERSGLPVSRRGEIMALQMPPLVPDGVRLVENPGPREIHALLRQAESSSFPVPEFEPFYLDLSHRTRHGVALSYGVSAGKILAACAVCSAVTAEAAVVSAVACAPGFRRRGYGGASVAALARRLNGRKIFVFRAEGENQEFYRSLGFRRCGGWAEIAVGT